MDERLAQAESCLSEANAVAQGLAMPLGSMEDELGVDPGFYALRACIGEIARKSDEASEALDMFAMEQQGADEE